MGVSQMCPFENLVRAGEMIQGNNKAAEEWIRPPWITH
jgi:hypothetical protein